MASSGSMFGSNPSPAAAPAFSPPPISYSPPLLSGCKIGEVIMMSVMWVIPYGTSRKWLVSSPSLFAAFTIASSLMMLSGLAKLMMSIETLFFLSLRPTSSKSSSVPFSIGCPTKTTILYLCDLFYLCLRESWATLTAVRMSASPLIWILLIELIKSPISFVCVRRSSTLFPAILNTPTVLSGFY